MKYSVMNQDENYLVTDSQLAIFLAHRPGIWIVQQLQEYQPPPELTVEELAQRKKYEAEKRKPFPTPLSRSL